MDFIKQIFLLCFTLACTVSSEKESASTTGVTTPTIPQKQPRKPKEVCYDHVGCFSLAPPFDDRNFQLPKSPEFIGTTFKLFTRSDEGSNDTVFLNYIDISTLKNSSFDPSLKTKFVIHGFSNDIKTEWPYEIKDELLKRGDFNVITVAWGPGAALPDLIQAVANTRVLAKQIEMVINMMVTLGSRYKDVHMIGHSLGAHTSGQVGQALRDKNITLGRISGLDPAEPNYKDHPKAMRLDKNDAFFVDVIHTNGAPFFPEGGAGLFEPCGDVDFYVNGGKAQPDCPNQIKGILDFLGQWMGGKNTSMNEVGEMASCSHSRSHEVFAESINSDCPFTAYPCSDFAKFQNGDCLSCGEEGCGTMGYYADQYSATGMMYLNTRSSKPFCGHHFSMKAKVSAQSTNTKGSLKVQLNGTWGISEWVTITKSTSDSLQAGKYVSSVVVTNGIIGRVKTVNVKYTKSGWRTKQQIKLQKISILNGEKSNQKYLVCFTNSPLSSGVSYAYPVTEQEDCVDKA